MKIKALLSISILFSIFWLCSSFHSINHSVVGTWVTYDDETNKAKSHVRIYQKNDKLYGKIIKLLNVPQNTKCTKCTGHRKNKPLIGMVIINDLTKDGNEWKNGTVFNPEKNKTYDCKIWLDRENTDKLYVRGYLGFFYKTQTWKRKK